MFCDWKTIGRRLKEQREIRGLSHVELSKQIEEKYDAHISRDSLMSYEVSDECHSKQQKNLGMRIEYLIYLADFYGVSADYLLGRTDIKTTNINIREICSFTGLSEEAVQSIYSLGRARAACYGGIVPSRNEVLSQLLESDILPKLLSNIAFSVYAKNLVSSRFDFESGMRAGLGKKGSLFTDLTIEDLTRIVSPLSSYIGVVPLDKAEAAELGLSMACDTLKEIVRGMKHAEIEE